MTDLQDLSPWPALIEAVERKLPGAPKLPDGIVLHTDKDGRVSVQIKGVCGLPKFLRPYIELDGWLAESILIRWSIEVGAWWERCAPSYRDFTIDAGRSGWHIVVNEIPSARECRTLIQGPSMFPDMLSACAAAIHAITTA